MTLSVVLGTIRALLALVGGGLIANGTVTADQWQTVAGAVCGLVTVGWSAYCHAKDSKLLVQAANAPAPAIPAVTRADAVAVAQGSSK